MDDFAPILQEVRTKSQVRELEAAIDLLLAAIFKSNEPWEKTLETAVDFTLAPLLRRLLSIDGAPISDRGQIEQILLDLRGQLRNIQIVKITLAFLPTEEVLVHLTGWFRTNVDDLAVLDITGDKSIIGGAIIEYNGRIKDLSLKTKLDKVFGEKYEGF